MPLPATHTELRISLGRLSRGLSALFWGLPIALILSVQAATFNWLGALGPLSHFAPPAAFALLLYGILLLRRFRPDEPGWTAALDRAQLLALTNLGLSPFLQWHQRLPDTALFSTAVLLLALFSLAFLLSLNALLRRLAAFLPDPLVQLETAALTRLSSLCLLLLPILGIAWMAAWRWPSPPSPLRGLLIALDGFRPFVFLFLTLLPLAFTMSLLWKIKETALECALHDPHEP
jgi:hypothetical protein